MSATIVPHCPPPSCPLPLSPVEIKYIKDTTAMIKKKNTERKVWLVDDINRKEKIIKEHQTLVDNCNGYLKKMSRKTGLRKSRDADLINEFNAMIENECLYELDDYRFIIHQGTYKQYSMCGIHLIDYINFTKSIIKHFTEEINDTTDRMEKSKEELYFLIKIDEVEIERAALREVHDIRKEDKKEHRVSVAFELETNKALYPNRVTDPFEKRCFDIKNKIILQHDRIDDIRNYLNNTTNKKEKYWIGQRLSAAQTQLMVLENKLRRTKETPEERFEREDWEHCGAECPY